MSPTRFVPSLALLCAMGFSLLGCFGPEDRRPGMRLPGEVAPTPTDWSFTREYPEIAIEVRTPYFLPHSVTIASGLLDDTLTIGALDPETKSWPRWVDADPEVRLGIGDFVYEVQLVPITDPVVIARIRERAFGKLGGSVPLEELNIRHWRVEPRD